MSSPEPSQQPDPNEPPDGQQPNPDGQQPDPNEPDENAWDEAAAKRKFERIKADLAKARSERDALKPLADEAEKRRKGELSEAQRLAEEKAALEVRVAEMTAAQVRRDAAEAAGLPSKFVKFVTAAEPDEALEQAKELAAALKRDEDANGANGTRRPDLRQGSRGASTPKADNPNDLIRRMAGHA